jgi:hypothetical protein
MPNVKPKFLVLFLVVPLACFGQELWHGTRYGMSKAKLQALFGPRLKAVTDSTSYVAYTLRDPERICGADFEVSFVFYEGGLTMVNLESQSGNPGGAIGQCVLNQSIAKWGNPYWVVKVPARFTGSPAEGADGSDYWFKYRRFSKGRLVLHINPKRVVIDYQRKAFGYD